MGSQDSLINHFTQKKAKSEDISVMVYLIKLSLDYIITIMSKQKLAELVMQKMLEKKM